MLPFLHTDTGRMYAIRGMSSLIGALAVWLVLLLMLEAGATPLIALLAAWRTRCCRWSARQARSAIPTCLLMAALAGLARSLLILCRGWTLRRAVHVSLWAMLALLTKPIGGPAALVMIVSLLAFGRVRGPRSGDSPPRR